MLDILRTPSVIETLQSESSNNIQVPSSALFGSIEFRNVSFSYPGRLSTPALNNVSFSVDPGSSIAFVGRSGGGQLLKLPHFGVQLFSARERHGACMTRASYSLPFLLT